MALPGLVRANNLSDVADKELAWNNLGKNFFATYYVSSPNFDANFASNKSLIDGVSGGNLITFNRASTGTFIGSNGVIQTAASGVPRFDYNPVTGESLGLLIEEARTNGIIDSTISPSYWNSEPARIFESGITGIFSQSYSFTGTYAGGESGRIYAGGGAGTVYTNQIVSVFLKLKTYISGSVGIVFRNGTSGQNTSFELQGGTAPIAYSNGPDWGDVGYQNLGNGWYRFYARWKGGNTTVTRIHSSPLNDWPIGTSFYINGFQAETGLLPSSHIPTFGTSVTRSADICNIISPLTPSTVFGQFIATNQGIQGVASVNNNTVNELYDVGVTSGTATALVASSGITRAVAYGGTTTAGTTARVASSLGSNIVAISVNGSVSANYAFSGFPSTTQLSIGRTPGGSYLNSTLSRLALWTTALPPIALRTLSASGIGGALTTYQSISGKDIAALNEVYKTSTRDFVFLRGLTSAIQPRITTASQNTTSGVSFSNTRLLDVSPSSIGNFFIASGSLNAQNLRVNGITVGSLSSIPFSGSTALFPLTISTMEMSSNFRFVPLFTSGVVSSPTIGVPVETSDFILYGKAGQS